MPDIDLGITRLISPPNPAAKGSAYNPTVEIKNFGRVSRSATGTIRIYEYARGIEIWRGTLSTPEIAPNEIYNAQTPTYWTASDEGEYIIIASIIVPGDQNPGNNNLSPVRIRVTTLPPPPPPAVQAHAQQHQVGGADEIVIEGLKGTTRDAQRPLPHAARHEKGGTDEIEISGLKGEAADPQKPKEHGNEAHTTAYVSLPTLSEHDLNPNAHSAAFQQHNDDREAHPAHNQDAVAHQAAIANHNADPNANHEAIAVHDRSFEAHENRIAMHNADPAAHPGIGAGWLAADNTPRNFSIPPHQEMSFVFFSGQFVDKFEAMGFLCGDVTSDSVNQPFGPLELYLGILCDGNYNGTRVRLQTGSGNFIVPFAIQCSGLHSENQQIWFELSWKNLGDQPVILCVAYWSLFAIRRTQLA
jgi:hypothetical protein